MEEDTDRTVAAWQDALQVVIKPKITGHSGRIVKLTGDGFLVEFPTVLDAVNCAIAMQEGLSSGSLDFRMGINMGDIVDDGEDIHGEGVNVAARIEGLAEPGGISISGSVHEQVRHRLDCQFVDMGEVKVKNVSEPVRLYQVLSNGKPPKTQLSQNSTRRLPPLAVVGLLVAIALIGWWQVQTPNPEAVTPVKKTEFQRTNPSIAVLPFINMSDDNSQEYFSDGMSEDLITDLSKISGLLVVARSSTFAYKGSSPDIRTVAKELNVQYVVEGSVRKAGEMVRITAQLIEADTGNHLWAERYDRNFNDIFAVQDEVREKIVTALAIKLSPDEMRRLARHPTKSPEAYELYLKGLEQVSFFNKNANLKSRELFEEAIAIDPKFAVAYAHLAQAFSLAVENNWTSDREKLIKQAIDTAKKGVELDGELPYAFWSLGRIYSRSYIDNQELALEAFKKSVNLNPNYADGFVMLGSTLKDLGRSEEAIGNIEKGMRLNPRFPFWYFHNLGQAQFFLTRFEAAAENLKKAIKRNPTVAWPRRWLVATYGQLNMKDDAEWEMSELESLGQPLTINKFIELIPSKNPRDLKLLLEGLRKAGVPEE